jgi:hypothetical protein
MFSRSISVSARGFSPWLNGLALFAAVGAQAAEFDCNNSLAYPDPRVFTQINARHLVNAGNPQIDDRYNHCLTTGQTTGAVNRLSSDGTGQVQAVSTTDFGLQKATSRVDARNLVGVHGSFAFYDLVDVNRDVITAQANGTQFVINTHLVFSTDRQVAGPSDTNGVSGNLQVSGPGIGINHTDAGLPASGGDVAFSTGLLTLNAGQTFSLTNYLLVLSNVSPNGIYAESPGWATLDASYNVTISVMSGSILAASGHDYTAPVPEPAAAGLLAAGLAALLALRHRRA